MNEEEGYYIGVDVGTGSVRAGLFSRQGKLLVHDAHEIKTWMNDEIQEGSYEQSSDDIWAAVCFVIKSITKGFDPLLVRGIGFDATCSLVVVDKEGHSVTVSPTLDPKRNIILWKDHRAIKEANDINRLGHAVLRFVGGCVSPEMEPPKLLWLRRYLLKESWTKAGHFFDLADYLVYRSTGIPARSLCTLVCKWTYIGHTPEPGCDYNKGWNDSFWTEIGLTDLVDDKYERIGTLIQFPGQPVGNGLNTATASQFGLSPGTPVATSLIDAHAGGMGMLGAQLPSSLCDINITSRLGIISGTSACHMATSTQPLFVPGVWGPYYSAMIPGYYLNEAGQSAAGSLLDHLLTMDTNSFEQLEKSTDKCKHSIYDELNGILSLLANERSLPHSGLLTAELHLIPDFHGNRSPLADPTLRGMISGLTLSRSVNELSIIYLGAVQSLAYGTKHIIEVMTNAGHKFEAIFVCGGLGQNRLYLQTHADVTGLPVIVIEETEAVLLGSAILAATASGVQIEKAMKIMSHVSINSVIKPCTDTKLQKFHVRKYQVFKSMLEDRLKYRQLMESGFEGENV